METMNWRVVSEFDDWVLLRNARGDLRFADMRQPQRDPADTPVTVLLSREGDE